MQVLGSESFLNIPDVNGKLLLVNGGSTGTITTGPFSSLPAAGTAGNLFVDSTNFVWYYDNGTTWTLLSTGPNPVIPGTCSLTFPVGTTAQRPATPTVGMMRYNTTTGSLEFYDTAWESLSGILAKSTVNVVQTSTTAATFLSLSIPANTLGTNGILRIKLAGIWAVTSGTARTMTPLISFGGTTMWSSVSGTLASGGTSTWAMEFMLAANNSTTAQTLTGVVNISPAGAGSVAGNGILTNTVTTPFASAVVSGTSAIASTSAQTLLVTMNSSGTGSTVTSYFYTVELL